MSNVKKSQKNIEKEDLLQAVVVVDDFENIFSGFTEEGSGALLPVANYRVIDYTLECLGRCGFQETILFCSSHVQALKNQIKKSPWSQPSSTMNIKVLVSEKCQSLGDALRDIDHKAVIKGDFLLLSAFTITNLNLSDLLKQHKQTCSKDRGAAMTLVLQDIGSRSPRLDDSTYVVNAVSNRLLMHVKSSSKIGKFDIPLEHLIENVNLNIYSNLVDTGVAVCSPSVPLLFSDNFDFQSKEDFVRGLLLNEEILDSRIYCHQVEGGYAATLGDWRTFQRVSLDCIHRWTFPLVPDHPFAGQDPFSYHRNCVYKQPGVQLHNSVKLEMDVVLGAFTEIGQKSIVLRSVIGRNCIIGENVIIKDSFIFDNTVIENKCRITLSVIGEKCRVKGNSEVRNCFLKRGVLVEGGSRLEGEVLGQEEEEEGIDDDDDDDDDDDEDEEEEEECKGRGRERGRGKWRWRLVDPEGRWGGEEDNDDDDDDEEEEEEEDEDEEEGGMEDDRWEVDGYGEGEEGEEWCKGSGEAEDADLFYSEVVDSLQRGFEERLSCENLILEINSSRYAYNVSLSDVTVLTLKGIILLSSRVKATAKELLSYFFPLVKNYVKTSESQLQCLELMEKISDQLGNDVTKCIHFLYDKDIICEDNILKWHEQLDADSILALKVAPLIKWLKEAAEESSSEDGSE